jgi:hypothetical protein
MDGIRVFMGRSRAPARQGSQLNILARVHHIALRFQLEGPISGPWHETPGNVTHRLRLRDRTPVDGELRLIGLVFFGFNPHDPA